MNWTSTTLLADLRRRGVEIQARGSRLHITAPRGAVSEEDRAALAGSKAEVLVHLDAEKRILNMSLDKFERQAVSLEVGVPWLDQSLWFAPRIEHVDQLAREGIARGRIWTARELRNLLSLPGIRKEHIHNIAQLRVAFDADVLTIEAAPQ